MRIIKTSRVGKFTLVGNVVTFFSEEGWSKVYRFKDNVEAESYFRTEMDLWGTKEEVE